MFLLMLSAPCFVALRSFSRVDEPDATLEDEAAEQPVILPFRPERPMTLAELASRAEADAMIAQELAREAQYAALAAAAHAARLRLDASIEASHAAEQAIRAADEGGTTLERSRRAA